MIPSLTLDDGVVEIVGDNGAHYLAYVCDISDPIDDHPNGGPTDKTVEPLITLRFENNWRPKESFPLSRIRLLPKTSANEVFARKGGDTYNGHSADKLTEGSEAEVWMAKNKGHECGFWKCVIEMAKDNFYGVLYPFKDKTHCDIDGKKFHEIVNKERIRPMNTNPYLKSNPFFKFVVNVPKELVAMNPKVVKSAEMHKNLRKALSLIAVNYQNSTNQLICIGINENDKSYAEQKTIKAAQLLVPIHFRAIRLETELRTQIGVFNQQFKNSDEIIQIKDNEFEILVRVEDKFMRFAIGTNGSNIKRVQQKPGILSIDRVSTSDEDINVFRVIGTDRNALRVAKQMLQITERVVDVPRDLVPHIIGKHGYLVQEMTDKSGLIIIKVKDEERGERKDRSKPYVPFHLIGTTESIENANILLSYQMSCVKENIEIDKKLSPKRVDKRRSQ